MPSLTSITRRNMKSQNTKICIYGIFTFVLLWSSKLGANASREAKQWRHHGGSRQLLRETFYPSYGESMPNSFQYRKTSTIFNVLNFGAKGDGTSDDTKVCKSFPSYLRYIWSNLRIYLFLNKPFDPFSNPLDLLILSPIFFKIDQMYCIQTGIWSSMVCCL